MEMIERLKKLIMNEHASYLGQIDTEEDPEFECQIVDLEEVACMICMEDDGYVKEKYCRHCECKLYIHMSCFNTWRSKNPTFLGCFICRCLKKICEK